jgi:ribosomal protein L11 methyltransferase
MNIPRGLQPQTFFIFMDNYIQVTVSFTDNQQCEILIALLSENGFEGFEESGNELFAFIPERTFYATNIDEIFSGMSLSYSKKIIEQTNWNEKWEKSFEPVSVDDFCGVRASFHEPIKNVEHEIIITPKMSFGTGHHATTFLMIQAMHSIDFENKKVLDFGTGTGILSILAEKLGAKNILAIDNDPVCVDNANENLVANNCSAVSVEEKDRVPFVDCGFDIILANINRNSILEQLPFFGQQLPPAGVLLVSGLLIEDFDTVRSCAESYGLDIVSKSLKNNWICLKFLANR